MPCIAKEPLGEVILSIKKSQNCMAPCSSTEASMNWPQSYHIRTRGRLLITFLYHWYRAGVEATASNKYIDVLVFKIGVLENCFINIYKLTIANPIFFGTPCMMPCKLLYVIYDTVRGFISQLYVSLESWGLRIHGPPRSAEAPATRHATLWN